MEAFTYKGISDGKYVDGEIEALNLDEASHKLKEQKIIITNIERSSKKKKSEEKDKKKGKGSSLFGKKKAKVEDVLMFSKQFATMVKAGLPILQVLGMLRDQIESPAMKDFNCKLENPLQLSVTIKKDQELNDLFNELSNLGVGVLSLRNETGRLEELFINLVDQEQEEIENLHEPLLEEK